MANEDFLDKYLSVEEFGAEDEYESLEPMSLFDGSVTSAVNDDDDEPIVSSTKVDTKSDILSELLKEKGITDPS
jgi:hypothetical protein